MRSSGLLLATSLFVWGWAHSTAVAAVGADVDIIAATGDPAPDGNGTLSEFGRVFEVNDNGDVLLYSLLSGTSGGGSDNEAIYLFESGMAGVKIVREGDPAPNGNGVFADTSGGVFFDGAFNNAATAAALSDLSGTTGGAADDAGIFRDTGAGIATMVREGDTEPGGPGVFQFFFNFNLGEGDHIAFFGGVDTDGNVFEQADVFGFWRVNPDGTVSKLVRDGDPAPGGGGFDTGNNFPHINASGLTAFNSNTSGAGGFGTFVADGSTVTTIVQDGDPIGGGDTVNISRPTDINDNGLVGVNTTINGNSSTRALLTGDGTTTTKLFAAGDALPGGGAASVQFFDTVLLNNNDEQAILITDSSFEERILFGDGVGGFTVVATTGDTVPNGDGEFSDIALLTDFNDNGAILFDATLINTSAGPGNVDALYFWNGGQPQELFRDGDSITLTRGTATLSVFGAGDLDDVDNKFGAFLQFTDGTDAVAIVTPRLNDDFASALPLASGITARTLHHRVAIPIRWIFTTASILRPARPCSMSTPAAPRSTRRLRCMTTP